MRQKLRSADILRLFCRGGMRLKRSLQLTEVLLSEMEQEEPICICQMGEFVDRVTVYSLSLPAVPGKLPVF